MNSSLYPSAQIDLSNNWPKTEIAYPFLKNMSDAFCSLVNSGRWGELKRRAFLTLKYHNPENLVFQHLPVKKIKNTYKNHRLDEINRMRNGIIVDNLTSVDIVEKVKCGSDFLEVFEGFFCHNLVYSLFTEFVTNKFDKRDLFKSKGKVLLQNLPNNLDCQSRW